MPEAKLSKLYRNWALVVDEQELRRLADECQRNIADGTNVEPGSVKLELEVQFSDGLSFTPEALDALLEEENPRGKSISGVELRASADKAEILCRLALEPSRASSLSVKGSSRQWVYVTFSRIEDRLRRMKQWHPRAINVLVPVAFTVAGLWIGLWILTSTRFRGLFQGPTADGKAEGTLLGFLTLLAGVPLTILVMPLSMALFPDPVFRIGDGAARHDRIKSARSKRGWALLAACVLAPLVRVLSSLFG